MFSDVRDHLVKSNILKGRDSPSRQKKREELEAAARSAIQELQPLSQFGLVRTHHLGPLRASICSKKSHRKKHQRPPTMLRSLVASAEAHGFCWESLDKLQLLCKSDLENGGLHQAAAEGTHYTAAPLAGDNEMEIVEVTRDFSIFLPMSPVTRPTDPPSDRCSSCAGRSRRQASSVDLIRGEGM